MAGTLTNADFAHPLGSAHPMAAISPAQYVQVAVLVASTAQTITLPQGTKFALFSSTASFYANFAGGTAAVPSASVTDGSGPVLNPGMRSVAYLCANDSLEVSVIASSSGILTVECWS